MIMTRRRERLASKLLKLADQMDVVAEQKEEGADPEGVAAIESEIADELEKIADELDEIGESKADEPEPEEDEKPAEKPAEASLKQIEQRAFAAAQKAIRKALYESGKQNAPETWQTTRPDKTAGDDIYDMTTDRDEPSNSKYDRSEKALDHEKQDKRTLWRDEPRHPTMGLSLLKEGRRLTAAMKERLMNKASHCVLIARGMFPDADSDMVEAQAQSLMDLPTSSVRETIARMRDYAESIKAELDDSTPEVETPVAASEDVDPPTIEKEADDEVLDFLEEAQGEGPVVEGAEGISFSDEEPEEKVEEVSFDATDEVLSSLFNEKKSMEEKQASKKGIKQAPVVKTASLRTEIDKLTGLWSTAPDVSEVFDNN